MFQSIRIHEMSPLKRFLSRGILPKAVLSQSYLCRPPVIIKKNVIYYTQFVTCASTTGEVGNIASRNPKRRNACTPFCCSTSSCTRNIAHMQSPLLCNGLVDDAAVLGRAVRRCEHCSSQSGSGGSATEAEEDVLGDPA